MSVQNVNQIDIDWKTVIALFSMIISFVSMLISLHSATKEERKERQIKRQKFDLIVRPSSNFRHIPPAQFQMELQQVEITKDFKPESICIVNDDIGDGDRYYGLLVKPGYDPLQIKYQLSVTQYFDKVYLTNRGNKKHILFKQKEIAK